jgi:uncharacterized membrane protein YphA (DoxX/SURF4 family)
LNPLYKKIIFTVLSLIIGGTFIFSAISKIPTLEQFGWTIVETTFLNWTMAEWFARILIGFEFFLGILFIIHFKIKKIAIPFSIALLTAFTLYLFLVIKQYGASGNCGCFGEYIPMTPLQSIFKNVGMIVILAVMQFIQYEWNFKWKNLLTIFLLLGSILIPILFSPPESIYLAEKEPILNKPIPLSLLYHSNNNKAPIKELRKGKHVIAFMSMTCEYCRKAAKRMRIMKEKNPSLPFYIILNGDSSKLNEFFDDTRAKNIDFSIFNGVAQFTTLADGHALPKIRLVNDTTVYKEPNYITMDEKAIETWLKK